MEKGCLVKYIHSELQPKESENTNFGVVSDKGGFLPCRRERVQNSVDWVSDRILGELLAVRATGQWNHPEVLTDGDTGLLELPHGWDTRSTRTTEGRF